MSYITKSIDQKTIELISQGGIGLLPTDTIYGLSAIALNQNAVEAVYMAKKRNKQKPLVVLISSIAQLNELGVEPELLKFAVSYWPAPLTVIVGAPNSPEYLHRGTHKLAIRMPAKEDLLDLINKAGPIVSTSANIEGSPVVKNLSEAQAVFGNKLDFYVDAGRQNNPPSTIVKLVEGKFKVIRQGAWQMPNTKL